MQKKFKLVNLECAHCAAKMERNILKLDNVNSCTINFMLETLIIDINDDVFDNTLTEVEKVIKKVEKDCYIKR